MYLFETCLTRSLLIKALIKKSTTSPFLHVATFVVFFRIQSSLIYCWRVLVASNYHFISASGRTPSWSCTFHSELRIMLFLWRGTLFLARNACSVMNNCSTIDLRTICRLNSLGSASKIEVFFEYGRLILFVQLLIRIGRPEIDGFFFLFVVWQQIVHISVFNRLRDQHVLLLHFRGDFLLSGTTNSNGRLIWQMKFFRSFRQRFGRYFRGIY